MACLMQNAPSLLPRSFCLFFCLSLEEKARLGFFLLGFLGGEVLAFRKRWLTTPPYVNPL